MTDDTLELAYINVGGLVETVNDAIAQDAVLAAIETVVKTRRADLKSYVLATLARPGAKAEHDGYGTALVTDPKPRAHVTDDDAFRAWALVTHPDRSTTVERLNRARLEEALAADDEISERLYDLLDEIPGALETEVVVDAGLADDVTKASAARETDDGRLVDKETGEVIPGVVLRMASTPSPRITPDKELVARLADEIAGRLPPLPTMKDVA